MNSGRLFLKRFRAESRFHFETFTWVIPKLYWFYILGPYAFFAIAFYRDLWEQPHFYWPEHWPFEILLAIGMIALSLSSFRTYLEEADLLYVLQNKQLAKGMRRLGAISSILFSIPQVAFILIILLPFVGHLEEVGPLFLLLFAYKIANMYVSYRFVNHWFGIVLDVILFVGTLYVFGIGVAIYGLVSLVLLVLILLLAFQKLEKNSRFSQEISVELKQKHKFIGFIFFASQFKEGEIPQIEKSPLSKHPKARVLFPKSRKIFKKRTKENELLEFVLKAFLRNPAERGAFLRMVSIPSMLILALPSVVQAILFVVMLIALYMFASGVFDKVVGHDFFFLVPVPKPVREAVKPRFCMFLVMPGMVIVGLFWYLAQLIR